jgi:hypothetical protein
MTWRIILLSAADQTPEQAAAGRQRCIHIYNGSEYVL